MWLLSSYVIFYKEKKGRIDMLKYWKKIKNINK